MSRSHERLINDNAPTPDQLFRLASVGMSAAARHNRLKTLSRVTKAHFFISEFGTYNGVRESEYPLAIRHRMAGRVGRKTLERVGPLWSLKFYDTYWVQQSETNWQAERTRYCFEWGRNGTSMAERDVRFLVPAEQKADEPDFLDAVAAFSFPDGEDVIWHTRGELATVTDQDCELLIKDAQEYYDRFARVEGAA